MGVFDFFGGGCEADGDVVEAEVAPADADQGMLCEKAGGGDPVFPAEVEAVAEMAGEEAAVVEAVADDGE